jgi:hypothetical protein
VVGPGLDNVYPYPMLGGTNNETNDNPGVQLTDDEGEAAEVFSASMFLLWTPNPAGGCSDNSCTIPVPLGSVAWGFKGNAINTLEPQASTEGTTWILSNCSGPQPTNPQFLPGNKSDSYPDWQTVVHNVQ